MTVHSFSGVGKGEDGVLELKERIKRTKRTRDNWKDCKVLVIDEVSMVTTRTIVELIQLSDDLFDKLDEIGRHVRGNSRSFGGIQLVLCGDFYQLPPVSTVLILLLYAPHSRTESDDVRIADLSIQRMLARI